MKNLNTFITESLNNYPNVKELGNGEFEGILWGHCFLYENKKYYSDMGWLNAFPSYCKMEINEEKCCPHQIDQYQRPELKKLFN